MNYQETLSWLYNQLPSYQKEGQSAYKEDINNMVDFFTRTNKDYLCFKTIHVGGTNGKGSVSHMLSSVLQESGLNVGLFTSPHLISFNERIKINGMPIENQFIIDFVKNHMSDFIDIEMSFFEMSVAMAFNYFKKKEVDIAIIEVGLGGRLDATNVLKPILSIITNISIDHTNLLGHSIDSIAKEKGGIIKNNTPVLIGEKINQSMILEDIAKSLNSSFFYAKNYNYSSDLRGQYQHSNINTCVTALHHINHLGFNVSEKHIVSGLNKVVAHTGLLGRWQIISKKPLVICDVAHNMSAIRLVFDQISKYTHKKNVIIGFSADKDLELIISSLPSDYIYYICGSTHSRIASPNELISFFNKHNLIYKYYPSVLDAYNYFMQISTDNDLLLITGSTFIVSDILKYLDKS